MRRHKAHINFEQKNWLSRSNSTAVEVGHNHLVNVYIFTDINQNFFLHLFSCDLFSQNYFEWFFVVPL